jgi:hypothetical protein
LYDPPPCIPANVIHRANFPIGGSRHAFGDQAEGLSRLLRKTSFGAGMREVGREFCSPDRFGPTPSSHPGRVLETTKRHHPLTLHRHRRSCQHWLSTNAGRYSGIKIRLPTGWFRPERPTYRSAFRSTNPETLTVTGEKSSWLFRLLAHPVTQVLGDRRSDGEVGLTLFFTRAQRPFRVVMLRTRELLPMNALYSNSISTRFEAACALAFARTPVAFATGTRCLRTCGSRRSGPLPQPADLDRSSSLST